MNSKFLVWTSLLIALLLHLALFNSTTFVFPIDPAALKPKFFFLGPILSKSDVKRASPNKNNTAPNSMLKNTRSTKGSRKLVDLKITDGATNPFAIGAIKKPLISQADEAQNKIVIKSTFESLPEKVSAQEAEVQRPLDSELKVQPYQPLRFRSP